MRTSENLTAYLRHAHDVILPGNNGAVKIDRPISGKIHVGVDLGTAYLVLVVLDDALQPLAGVYQFAEVVKDGLVVDFIGAVERLRHMKKRLEERIGRPITSAATSYPPGVPMTEIRATANVVRAAGMECETFIDEPSAANNLLEIENGAIIDVGGGTTGIAVVKDGEIIYTADEATGGTHFTLVIAGAKDISFKEAEAYKIQAEHYQELFPVVRPVMEKVANIAARHIQPFAIEQITMVGGAVSFAGFDKVVESYTGIPTVVPDQPFFVTPIGIAMQQAMKQDVEQGV